MTIYDKQYRAVDSFRLEAVDQSDDGERFEWDESTLVTIDNQPWQDAFGTDQFHKAEYVVTKPAEQPYVIDGKRYTFTKPRTDLKQAQWRLDNLPWTIEHPPEKRVVSVDEARGFWRGPYYDDSRDEQRVALYIPTTDEEALEYAAEHEGVSVGFTHTLTRVDEYEGEIGGDVDVSNVDALQTDIYYDHVATVETPRLPDSGPVADSAFPEGNSDALIGTDSENGGIAVVTDSYDDGDDDDEDVRDDHLNPTPHIDYFAEVEIEPQVTDGSEIVVRKARATRPYYVCAHLRGEEYHYMSPSLGTSIGDDGPHNTNVVLEDHTIELEEPLVEDAEVFVTLHYTDEEGEKAGHILGEKNWVKDSATIVFDDTNDGASTIQSKRSDSEAPEGIYVSDNGTWHAVAPDEHTHDSTEHDDDAMYPLTSCTGENSVEAAWNLREHSDALNISVDTLESRIRRAAREMQCDLDFVDEQTDSTTFNMSDGDFDIDDLTVDTIAEQNDEVADLVEENETLSAQVDELDSQKEAVESELESVREELDSYKDEERQEKIDTLTDLTDHWDEEDLEDVSLDTLDERIELIQNLRDDPTTPKNDGGENEESGSDNEYGNGPMDLSHTA